MGLGAGTPSPGAALSAGLSGVGLGSDKGSASSTSTAGISGVAGHSTARTGDQETGLQQIFNKEQVRAEVNAQTAITGEFGKQASKAVGDYAKTKYDEAERNKDQAGMEAWKEGGASRVALHTLVGGLTAGAAGAVGAGSASAAAPKIEELQTSLKTALKEAGVGDSAANLISSLAGGATAAGIGGAASGGSATGAATAFNADMNNRQLHPSERKKAKELAAKSGGRYTQEQIEEQMRLMGNAATGDGPNEFEVLVGTKAIVSNITNDPGMPGRFMAPWSLKYRDRLIGSCKVGSSPTPRKARAIFQGNPPTLQAIQGQAYR